MVSGRDSGGLGGILAPRRDSGGLGGIVASGRDSGRLGGIVASGRVSAGTGGASTGLGGRTEGFRRVDAFVDRGTRLLGCILGSNGCKAFLLIDLALVARHEAHVARTLLAGFEAS